MPSDAPQLSCLYTRCSLHARGWSRASFDHCHAERARTGGRPSWSQRAVMILHGSLSAPSLWTSQAASENHSLMMHLRKPVVRGMVYCIGVLTSERTHCYAGCFIKSLKGTSLIVPEISTFHVAGAACCSAPGNGTNSLSGSKQSGF